MNSGCISHAEVPAFQGTILCFSHFWQTTVGIYTWLDLRLLLTPYPFCSGFIKHYFFKFLGNLVAQYWRVVSLASHWIIIGIIATVSAGLLLFSAWFLYIMYFPCGTDQLIYTFFSGILEKNPILSPCISLMLILLYEDNSCRIWISEWILQNAGFPTKITGGLQSSPHTPLSSGHHIWLDCCFGNRCNVESDFIMIKWGEKNRTKEHIPVSTCNLEIETVSHTFSVFQSTFW